MYGLSQARPVVRRRAFSLMERWGVEPHAEKMYGLPRSQTRPGCHWHWSSCRFLLFAGGAFRKSGFNRLRGEQIAPIGAETGDAARVSFGAEPSRGYSQTASHWPQR